MRKVLASMLLVVLLPAAAAAQKAGQPGAEVGRKVPVFRVSKDAAINTALARVRADLAAGRAKACCDAAWGDEGGRIKPSTLGVKSGEVATTTDGNYVVAVTAANAPGHVRVLVNGQTGAVISALSGPWAWAQSPGWWVKGLSSPPTEKKGEDTLSVKARR